MYHAGQMLCPAFFIFFLAVWVKLKTWFCFATIFAFHYLCAVRCLWNASPDIIYDKPAVMFFKKGSKIEFPNTYVIIFAILVVAALATWVVPGGEYVERDGGMEFVPVVSVPQTWQLMSALFEGFTRQAGIIVFILIIGGAFWIVNSVRAVDAGIFSFLRFARGLERYAPLRRLGVHNLIIVLVMLLFSLFGAVFGMSEETIAFVVIVIPLAISMGYDSIVGVCMVYVAAHVGFAGAMLNPFTIGIAQDIAGLPMFSGMGYRFFCWLVLNVITVFFVLRYAARVKRNPASSPMYRADAYWREHVDEKTEVSAYSNRSSRMAFVLVSVVAAFFTWRNYNDCVLSFGTDKVTVPWLLPVATLAFIICSWWSLKKSVQFFVLNLLLFTIVYLVIGVLGYSWYITEISALFLSLGLLAGIAAGYSPNRIVKEFMDGAKDIFSAALVVGLAAGIIVILEDGRIIGTLLHSMASSLGESGQTGSLGLMYAIQTLINLVIPSASAKAAITMPIMAPFSDLIGLSRQATVMAFQFGDGFTNMITPTSGVLIAVLGIARIPYGKWVKFILPFIIGLIVVGFLLLLPTVYMQLDGF